MAFLEKNGLRGWRGIGDARQSIVGLLSPADQATYARQQAEVAAAEAARVAALPVSPALIPTAACDGPGQAAAVASAKAHGGCVDVTVCDNQGRVAAVNRQCWEDPVAKAALVNQIKADEIEAGALERMLEMAKAPASGSPESVSQVQSESAALLDDVAEYEAIVAQDAAEAQAQSAARDRLAALAAEARSRAGRSR